MASRYRFAIFNEAILLAFIADTKGRFKAALLRDRIPSLFVHLRVS
jgi:hypothetical protein